MIKKISLLGILLAGLLSAEFALAQANYTKDPCANTNAQKSSAIISITTAATTQLVALSGTTSIYVCEFSLTISQVAVTPNTIKFVYGTGASCGTGQQNLTGIYGDGGVTAAQPITIQTGGGNTIMTAPASNALCVTTAIGATASYQGVVSYVQQ